MKGKDAERISHIVLYAMMGLTALVFLLFYFIGFDNTDDLNDGLVTPMFTDLVIILTILLIVASSIIAVVSKVQSVRKNKQENIVNGIPAKRITYSVTAFTIVLCIISFALIPVSPLTINAEEFDNTFWLRVSNMCIITAFILLIASVGAIIFGIARNRRFRVVK